MTAESTRHLATFWRGEKPWHWWALKTGHVQPLGYRTHFKHRKRRMWQLHVTPLHVSRDGEKWEFGLCFGKRTIYVMRHR